MTSKKKTEAEAKPQEDPRDDEDDIPGTEAEDEVDGEDLDEGAARILVDLVASEDDLATRLAAALSDVMAMDRDTLSEDVREHLDDLKDRLTPEKGEVQGEDWLEESLGAMSSDARIHLAEELVALVLAIAADEAEAAGDDED